VNNVPGTCDFPTSSLPKPGPAGTKKKKYKSEARNPKSETNPKYKCSKFKTKEFSTLVTKYNLDQAESKNFKS